jgi:hypothetical protein
MKRTRDLALKYADQTLPEQYGQDPLTRWCPECRTALGGAQHFATGVAKTTSCKRCGGSGRISP